MLSCKPHLRGTATLDRLDTFRIPFAVAHRAAFAVQNPRVNNDRSHADQSRAGRPILGSERLRLEPVVPAHVDLFVKLNSDPEVMRFILGRGASEAETRQEWSQPMGPQTDAARGLGYWAGFTVGGTFLGWWSASAFREDDRRAGLGYRLVRSSWGLGYATEGPD